MWTILWTVRINLWTILLRRPLFTLFSFFPVDLSVTFYMCACWPCLVHDGCIESIEMVGWVEISLTCLL